MPTIADFRLQASKSVPFLTAVNAALAEADVAAIDRTLATQLMLAEILAKACPLPGEGVNVTEHFRSAVLPQLQTLLSSIVEVARINIEQVTKLTFQVYKHRYQLATGENVSQCRPCVEEYVKDLDVAHGKIVTEYPTLPRMYWSVQDVLLTKSSKPNLL